MRSADGLDDYLQAPIGRYLAGEHFLHWYATPGLSGLVLWGRPGKAQVEQLTRVLEVERPPAAPHVSLVDARRLETPDMQGFTALVRYMQPRNESFGRTVRRQALLRPDGVTGAVVASFYEIIPPAFPIQVFTEPAEAITWLGVPAEEAHPLFQEVTEQVVERLGHSSLLRELREVLRPRLLDAHPAEVARLLGLSERTLQRRLREAGTSLEAELHLIQVRTAQALLRGSDARLTEVALEVGCASLQHFSHLFRKVTGESPSTWRARHRKP